jgi:hypothetical protein
VRKFFRSKPAQLFVIVSDGRWRLRAEAHLVDVDDEKAFGGFESAASQEGSDDSVHPEFFVQFPLQSCLWSFSWFQLAAGKLPAASR